MKRDVAICIEVLKLDTDLVADLALLEFVLSN